MHCPECSHRVAPFRSWILWPGPTRSCQHCGAQLRYQGFHTQAAIYALLVLPLVSIPFRLTAHEPLAFRAAIGLLGLLFLAPLCLPWWLSRYTLARPGQQLRDFGFALALFATGITLYYSLTRWQGSRALAQAVTVLEQKHEPMRIEDLQTPSIPEERNIAAAPIFKEVFENPNSSRLSALTKLPGLPPAGNPNRWQGFAKRIDPKFSGSEAEAIEWLKARISPNDALLAEVNLALQRPEVRWPHDFSKGFAAVPSQINAALAVARCLSLRAQLRLDSGQSAEALEDCLALIRLTRAQQQGDYLIESLVFYTLLESTRGVLTEAMPRRAWTAQTWSRIADELDRLTPIASAVRGLRVERVLQMTVWPYPDILQQFVGSGTSPAIRKMAFTLMPSGWHQEDLAAVSHQTQGLIETLLHPESLPRHVSELLAKNEARSLWQRLTTPICGQLFQSIGGVCQTALAAETLSRCTATACRLLAHLEPNAPLPKSASELEALMGCSVPQDPLSGKPLLYRVEEPETFAIYGTGWNGQDDGGQNLLPDPASMRWEQRRDWGVRLQLRRNATPNAASAR
jgi:hypothetical protein